MIAYGRFLFRHRNWVFPLFMVVLFVAFRPVPAGGTPETDRWLDLVGVALVLIGVAVRWAVVGLAYIKRGGLRKSVYADDLVTVGMFAHSRNPLYVGNLLMLAGYLTIHNNPWAYVLGGAFFLTAYHAIVAAEEAYLADKFGDRFTRYCRSVPRWTIRTRGLVETFHNMEFNWRRVLVKDYSTADTGTITVLALFAWETVNFVGLERARDTLIVLGVLLVVAQLFTLAVLVMKKTGRLRA